MAMTMKPSIPTCRRSLRCIVFWALCLLAILLLSGFAVFLSCGFSACQFFDSTSSEQVVRLHSTEKHVSLFDSGVHRTELISFDAQRRYLIHEPSVVSTASCSRLEPRPLQIRGMCEPYSPRPCSNSTLCRSSTSCRADGDDLLATRIGVAPKLLAKRRGRFPIDPLCVKMEIETERDMLQALRFENMTESLKAMDRLRTKTLWRNHHAKTIMDRGSNIKGSKINILISFALGYWKFVESSGVQNLRVFVWSFLRHCDAANDELHILIDQPQTVEQWHQMIDRLGRRIIRTDSNGDQLPTVRIILVNRTRWLEDRPDITFQPHQTNVRWLLFHAYLSRPQLFAGGAVSFDQIANIITLDSRDLIFQANPFPVLEKIISRLRREEHVYGDEEDGQPLSEFLIVAAEEFTLLNNYWNRVWTRLFVGARGDDLMSVRHGGRASNTADFGLTYNAIPDERMLPRTLPTGRAVPAINSGVVAGTYGAMRELAYCMDVLLSSPVSQGFGRDQGAFTSLLFFIAPAVGALQGRTGVFLLHANANPLVRHHVGNNLHIFSYPQRRVAVPVWLRGPKTEVLTEILNCMGEVVAISHQADRHADIWLNYTRVARFAELGLEDI